MTFPLEPLGGFVIVEQDAPEDKSKGGVHVPDVGRRKPLQGRVVAAGPGHRHPSGFVEPMPVVAGDMILFGWQDVGTEVEYGGEKYRILHVHALLAILKRETDAEPKNETGRSKGRRPVRTWPRPR